MPKIISRAIISTSEQTPQVDRPPLHTYYCQCGEFAFISDAPLALLPKRQTDLAVIVSQERRVFRLMAKDGDAVVVKRDDDRYEKQYRKYCTRCQLWLAYEVPTEPDSEQRMPFLYIVDGALIADAATDTRATASTTQDTQSMTVASDDLRQVIEVMEADEQQIVQ